MAEKVEVSVLSELPCGVEIDRTKGECCLNMCQRPEVKVKKGLKATKATLAAIEACTYWVEKKAADSARRGKY